MKVTRSVAQKKNNEKYKMMDKYNGQKNEVV